MNKAKVVLGLIIFGFFGLLVFQNQELFFQQQKLGIDLFVIEKIEIPKQFLAVFFLVFFLLGLFIAYGSGLYARWRSVQMVKGLNQKINSLEDIIAKLEVEKDALEKKRTETSRHTSVSKAQPSPDNLDDGIQTDKNFESNVSDEN
jgi:hypothetical protein